MSSGVEPCSVAFGEFVVGASAELEFSDPGGPYPEVCGGGGEGEVLGASGRSQIGVVGHGAVSGKGLEDLSGDRAFESTEDGADGPTFGQMGVAVCLGDGVVGHADLHDVVQSGVGLPVAAAGQAVSVGASGADRDRCSPAQGCE